MTVAFARGTWLQHYGIWAVSYFLYHTH